ncbi:hypothetical protein LCGC14_1102520 [marine sediment metagenome]|uniref:Uncharacterized protein n=1 Tax=marine sediment metagenome TaxID=412755 RepID=A0A0F9PSC6_9ZZZZ
MLNEQMGLPWRVKTEQKCAHGHHIHIGPEGGTTVADVHELGGTGLDVAAFIVGACNTHSLTEHINCALASFNPKQIEVEAKIATERGFRSLGSLLLVTAAAKREKDAEAEAQRSS